MWPNDTKSNRRARALWLLIYTAIIIGNNKLAFWVQPCLTSKRSHVKCSLCMLLLNANRLECMNLPCLVLLRVRRLFAGLSLCEECLENRRQSYKIYVIRTLKHARIRILASAVYRPNSIGKRGRKIREECCAADSTDGASRIALL